MAPSSRPRRNHSTTQRSGTLRGYRSPFWRDTMFWITAAIALFAGGLIVIALFMLLSTPTSTAGWAWTLALFIAGTWIGFVLLSLGLNTARGVSLGSQEADSARGDRYEAHGRKAGKFVGKGLAKATGRSSGKTSPAQKSAGTDSPPQDPKPTLDDAARSIGMMVGRRLGGRKDKP